MGQETRSGGDVRVRRHGVVVLCGSGDTEW